MGLSHLTTQLPKTFSELEKENDELRRRLKQAEDVIQRFQSGVHDTDERQQVYERLRQSEQRLEMELADTKLLQSISAHLIQEDSIDALYTRITEAAQTITQSDFASMQIYYPERGTAGQLRLLASSGLTQEGKDFWAWVDANAGTTCAVAMRTGKRFVSSNMYTCEFVVGTPDHEMFARAGVLAAQSTPLFSRSGKLLGMISTHWQSNHTPSDRDLNLLDILARQAADLLERKAAAEALQQSQVALTEADRRKDEFLATLSHELRNPLAPIRNALHIMRVDPGSEKFLKMIEMMDRQMLHLVRLIDDLLDVSRISQGKIDLRRERMTLQSAVADAIETCRSLIDNNAHKLTIDLQEEPVWIYADPTRVAQVVSNLINNAAKYTPPGGQIFISARSEDTLAALSVTDTGLGIPADMLPKVFDLFTQVDRNLHRSQGGLGIGLALVKQLLDMHGGEIVVNSAGLNEGSTFTVHLPLAIQCDADIVSDSNFTDRHETASVAKTLRVLVVDDNVDSAETIGLILELQGHKTRLAFDGCEALVAASAFNPDAILLDIDLPGLNGHEVCRELRKNPLFKNTLVIAQSGFGQERDRKLAKESGFDHHLVKPFDFTRLSGLLSTVSLPLVSTSGL